MSSSAHRPPESVASSLVTFYGKNERSRPYEQRLAAERGIVRKSTALRIGQACKFLHNQGQVAGAHHQLRRARDEISSALQSGDPAVKRQRTSLLLARHTASLILKRQNPTAVANEVQAMRATIAEELYTNIQADNELYDHEQWDDYRYATHAHHRGAITELTCLGLGLRRSSPWRLATSALWHYDQGHVPTRNFDSLYVEARPEGSAAFYRLQTKAACIGTCDEQLMREEQGIDKLRPLYNNNIRILSGHCDFGFKYDREIDADNVQFSLAHLVIKETFGTPTDDELAQLDAATDHMVFTLKYDDYRRGTYGPRMNAIEATQA